MADAFGIYQGTVMNVNDPADMGRVQVLVPAISGQTSGWAKPCGDTDGVKIGDQAWVMFEGGNPSSPIYMGASS